MRAKRRFFALETPRTATPDAGRRDVVALLRRYAVTLESGSRLVVLILAMVAAGADLDAFDPAVEARLAELAGFLKQPAQVDALAAIAATDEAGGDRGRPAAEVMAEIRRSR